MSKRKPRRICGVMRRSRAGDGHEAHVAPCGGTFKPALEEKDENGVWQRPGNRFHGARMRYSPTLLECQQCGRTVSRHEQ